MSNYDDDYKKGKKEGFFTGYFGGVAIACRQASGAFVNVLVGMFSRKQIGGKKK